MKRLLMIAFNFPPKVSAGTYRSLRFAKYLPLHNWQTVVLTEDSPRSQEAGVALNVPEEVIIYRTKVFDFYNWCMKVKSKVRGIHHKNGNASSKNQIVKPSRGSRSVWERFKDAASLVLNFPDSKVGWVPLAVWRGWQIVRKEQIQVLYTSGPPHSSHGIGWALKCLTGKPWVVDFRDPWARQGWLKDYERQPWRLRMIEVLERWVVSSADTVILNTKPMLEAFIRQYPEYPRDKFVYIPNGFDPDDFIGFSAKQQTGPFRLIHAGALYRKRNPAVLLQAARQLLIEGFCTEQDFEIEFIGPVSLGGFSLQSAIEELGLQQVVKWIPHLPHRTCIERLFDADALIVIQPEADVQVPGKIYEYMKIGKPILTLAHEGAIAQFVQEYQLGPVANPDKLEDVLYAMKDLYLKYRSGGQQMSTAEGLIQRYDARVLAAEFETTLTQCLAK